MNQTRALEPAFFFACHARRRDPAHRGIGLRTRGFHVEVEARQFWAIRNFSATGLNSGRRCCSNVSGDWTPSAGTCAWQHRLRGPDAERDVLNSIWRSTRSSPACCSELFWPIGTHSAGAQMLLDDRRASHGQNIVRHVRNYRCTRPDYGARADLSARNDAGPRADKHVGSADYITCQVARKAL